MKHEHPLITLRKRAGISRRELAILAGVAYMAIYEVETGIYRGIPRALRKALADMDADVPQLEADIAAWREACSRALSARLRAERPSA
jgi:transcriptional regulator with XRE-family HTH domain